MLSSINSQGCLSFPRNFAATERGSFLLQEFRGGKYQELLEKKKKRGEDSIYWSCSSSSSSSSGPYLWGGGGELEKAVAPILDDDDDQDQGSSTSTDDHHQDQGGTTWAAKLPLSVASRVNCLLLLMHTRHWCTLLDTGAHYFTLLHAALNVLQCTNLSLCNEHWRCHRTTISISLQQFSKHCFLTKKCFTSEKLFGRMVEEEREDSQSQSWRPTLLYCILWKQTTISAVIETKDVIHWLMLGQKSTAVGFLNL